MQGKHCLAQVAVQTCVPLPAGDSSPPVVSAVPLSPPAPQSFLEDLPPPPPPDGTLQINSTQNQDAASATKRHNVAVAVVPIAVIVVVIIGEIHWFLEHVFWV
jgi:hypothetical protein